MDEMDNNTKYKFFKKYGKSHVCVKCGKGYVLSSSLKTHMLSHVNDPIYKCSRCQMTFADEELLKQHLSDCARDKNLVDDSSHLHDICAFGTSTSNAKGKHKKLKQLRVYRRHFKCPECPVTFLEKVELKDHISSHANHDDVRDTDNSVNPEQDVNEHDKVRMGTRFSGSSNILKSDTRNLFINEEFTLKCSPTRDVYCRTVCPVCREMVSVGDNLVVHMATHANSVQVCAPVVSKSHDCKAVTSDKTNSVSESEKQNCKRESVPSRSVNECDLQPSNTPERLSYHSCLLNTSTDGGLKEIVTSGSPFAKGSSKTRNHAVSILRDQTNVSTNSIGKDYDISLSDHERFTILLKCLNCPMTFLTRTEIESHILTCNNDDNLKFGEKNSEEEMGCGSSGLYPLKLFDMFFKCTLCPLIFLEQKEVESHILTHSACVNTNPVQIKSESDNNAVSVQIKLEKSDNNAVSVQIKSEESDNNAVSESSGIPIEPAGSYYDSTITIFQSHGCPVCSTFFSTRSELGHHILSCHKTIDSNAIPLPFEVCSSEEFGQNIIVSSFNVLEDGTVEEGESGNSSTMPHLGLTPFSLENSKAEVSLEGNAYKCSVCGKEFDDEKKFMNHKRIHGVKKHSCKLCGKNFRANSYLKVHMSVHSDQRPHKCSHCNKSFKSSGTLKIHETVHLEARPFKCSICDATFKLKNSLILHGFVHSANRPFKCEMCEKSFKTSHALKGHEKIHSGTNEKKLYFCTICCKTYSNEKNYQYHMRLHSGDVPHKCQYCGKGFIVKPLLTQHLRIHTGERPFKCPMCEKRFAVKSTLRNHMDTHSDVKRYVCHICGVHITQRQTLSSHLKKHTGVKQHVCDICGKKFYLKSNYKRHMRTHNGERPYQCVLCSKTFTQNAHLKNHMASHKGEKPYQCNICNKYFTYKSSLRNHMVIHSVDKPFVCVKCGKSFRSRGSLKVHHLTHNTEENFGCPDCGKKFRLESSLQVHLKKKFESATFTCQMCKRVFTRRACLYQHKKTHLMETEVKDIFKQREVCEMPVKDSEELESIKVTEALEDFDGHESIQVHIIV